MPRDFLSSLNQAGTALFLCKGYCDALVKENSRQ